MLKKIIGFLRTMLNKIKPRRKRKIKIREREPDCIIHIGDPLSVIRKSIKMDIRVPNLNPATIDVGHCDPNIRFAATVDRIRFKGSPFEIFIVFAQACNNAFGHIDYRPGEIIYCRRGSDDVIFRETFMICADTVNIRPIQSLEEVTKRLEEIGTGTNKSLGDLIMYEPAVFGYHWVDLMWGSNIYSLDAVKQHFRNDKHYYTPNEEDIFQKNCEKFYRLCRDTVAGRMPVVL
jgi:hypothetical protein